MSKLLTYFVEEEKNIQEFQRKQPKGSFQPK
jgi:hypothetical protein